MKAWSCEAPRFGPCGSRAARSRTQPVLVRVTHSGVCEPISTSTRARSRPPPADHGHEMIGEVVDGGDATLHRGDRVIVDPAIYCGMCLNCRAAKPTCVPTALSSDAIPTADSRLPCAPRSHVYPCRTRSKQRCAVIQVATTCMHGHHLIKFSRTICRCGGPGVAGQIHVQLAKAWELIP